MRRLDMSITPKADGMEDQVVRQMRATPGGIARMIEHWVEKYHQVGYKYDKMWRRQPDEGRKAQRRSHREHIAGNYNVVRRLDALENEYSKGERKRTVERREVHRENKRVRRIQTMSEAMMLDSTKEDLDAAELLMTIRKTREGTQAAL